jgi:hypothetical protein
MPSSKAISFETYLSMVRVQALGPEPVYLKPARERALVIHHFPPVPPMKTNKYHGNLLRSKFAD